jgi:pentatricopeptide repeat protein
VHAAAALLSQPEVLQPYHNRISSVLSEYYTAHPAPDADIAHLQAVLADACLTPRHVASQRERSRSNFSIYTVANRYAGWLVAEAQRAGQAGAGTERLQGVLDRFEAQVRTLATDRLMVPYAAAWAVLLAAAGRAPPPVAITLPHESTVMGWVTQNAWEKAAGAGAGAGVDADADADVAAAARALCGEDREAALPTTPDLLSARLLALRNRRKPSAIVDMWRAYAAELDLGGRCTHPLASGQEVRADALAKFLWVVRSGNSNSAIAPELAAVEAEVRARVPVPTPLPVLHVLLTTAGPEDLEGDAERLLASSTTLSTLGTTQAPAPVRTKETVLAAAAEIWESARSQGVVRDERLYRLYMALLGRYHAGEEMFRVWDELVADKQCRALEEQRRAAEAKAESKAKEAKEAKSKDATWPSTLTLNQVLSSGFLVGSQTSEMAIALFGLALDPKTALKPNLVTLNIALRYAAHLANIDLMTSMLSSALPLGLTPDIVTYTTLVQGMLRAGRPELARATLDSMKARGINPNERMAAMLVADLAASGTKDGLVRAEEVVRDMRVRGIRTTVPMWTSLIAGYFRGGWEVDAWNAVERMRVAGLRLNDVGYNIVLGHVLDNRRRRGSAAKDDKSIEVAMELFRSMQKDDAVPTSDTYMVLLGGLLRSGSIEHIPEVLAFMDARRFSAPSRSVNDMIRKARKALTQSPRMRE